jgi:hypothetical protein
MDESTTAKRLAGRIGDSIATIASGGAGIASRSPLPADARIGHDEDAWGPREVLAHVGEAVPFWLGEIERILAADPASGPAPFGRTAADEARAMIIDRDRTLPVDFLLARLERDGAALGTRVGGLSPVDLARACRHPAWGDMTLVAMIERTLAGHLEGHVEQLRRILAN